LFTNITVDILQWQIGNEARDIARKSAFTLPQISRDISRNKKK